MHERENLLWAEALARHRRVGALGAPPARGGKPDRVLPKNRASYMLRPSPAQLGIAVTQIINIGTAQLRSRADVSHSLPVAGAFCSGRIHRTWDRE
jgi:hypothetical protein